MNKSRQVKCQRKRDRSSVALGRFSLFDSDSLNLLPSAVSLENTEPHSVELNTLLKASMKHYETANQTTCLRQAR